MLLSQLAGISAGGSIRRQSASIWQPTWANSKILPHNIHDIQRTFVFIGLRHECRTFPHVHDIHYIHFKYSRTCTKCTMCTRPVFSAAYKGSCREQCALKAHNVHRFNNLQAGQEKSSLIYIVFNCQRSNPLPPGRMDRESEPVCYSLLPHLEHLLQALFFRKIFALISAS